MGTCVPEPDEISTVYPKTRFVRFKMCHRRRGCNHEMIEHPKENTNLLLSASMLGSALDDRSAKHQFGSIEITQFVQLISLNLLRRCDGWAFSKPSGLFNDDLREQLHSSSCVFNDLGDFSSETVYGISSRDFPLLFNGTGVEDLVPGGRKGWWALGTTRRIMPFAE